MNSRAELDCLLRPHRGIRGLADHPFGARCADQSRWYESARKSKGRERHGFRADEFRANQFGDGRRDSYRRGAFVETAAAALLAAGLPEEPSQKSIHEITILGLQGARWASPVERRGLGWFQEAEVT